VIDLKAVMLSRSLLVLRVVSPPELKLPEVVVPYSDIFSRTSEAIWRKSGRRMAMEAAMMPVPGSAVAQIVALIESAIVY
jgi:hypothetical protein